MSFDFVFMLKVIRIAAARIPATLIVATIPLLIGCIIGLPIALARFFRVRILSSFLKWTVTILKGIPVVLFLLTFYVLIGRYFDVVMQYFHINFGFKDLNKGLIVVAALSIPACVSLSEVFRGALASVKNGQFDAAYSIGHSRNAALWRIILPQAFPVSLPMICNMYIGFVKAASLASMVSVIDVLNAAIIAATMNYRYLEAYVAAALIYWLLCVVIERIFIFLEKWFGKKIREAAV
ncbi:ABC-type amino acid transport system, permease component [Treponema primitia ZAS-2]|uniref:ABC-type amino acid transport system, permease component n=1 Tax=Treponema primitia (strain ATCC BAA-887 / DSM 12427 / ZAS-2) TaxID=545694 RepID=F5YK79_TREPZ|nr:ABC transporter permease subunit [Treponema primitia]AEF85037.1 ABC-type amino acid transport system, permease component [Treponema primitia ZAS-2]